MLARVRDGAAIIRRVNPDSDLSPLPPRLQVEVTNRCSLGCASCARHGWDAGANRPGELQQETLEQLAPLLDAAVEVTIGGYGDPSEGEMLLPLLHRAKAAGCSVRMITGGAKLSPALIESLIDGGLDRLVLSMDGARDETLRSLRGVPKRAWLKWIRTVRTLREDRDSFRPMIQLNFVAQWPNVEELPELVDLCADEGVAGIHAFHIKAYRPESLDLCLLTDPDAARPHFDEARRRAELRGVFLHLPPLDGAAVDCRQPFEHLFVRHDGTVRGCCSGLFEPADFGLAVGTLHDGGEALWRAPILEKFRAASRSGNEQDFPLPCRSCAFRLPRVAAHNRVLSVLPPEEGQRRVS
ncbi:MAG: radical SAM protein [Myxococcota bacterium]|nr:radical SAM protein [Myxococcota bacterium]